MQQRKYRNSTFRILKDGTKRVYYHYFQKRWVQDNAPKQRTWKKGQGKTIWSNRFGFLNLYSGKEQRQLKCPSGYTVTQCFLVLPKLWAGYHRATKYEKDIEKMEKYARAIQGVQKDLGIKTTSFPHLGIFGDEFILNDHKTGERLVYRDDSALAKKQEEFEKRQAENSKKIQELLQQPDEDQSIETYPDESYADIFEVDEEDLMPNLQEPREGQSLAIYTDDIPFRNKKWKGKAKRLLS